MSARDLDDKFSDSQYSDNEGTQHISILLLFNHIRWCRNWAGRKIKDKEKV